MKGYRMSSLLARLDAGVVRHTYLQQDSETLPTGTISPGSVLQPPKTSLIDLTATESCAASQRSKTGQWHRRSFLRAH